MTIMHLKAAEAVGALNKLKWANTTAKERLKILEQLQERLLEEMEDLGVEEAEMKNLKIGTTDNPYAGDACRLTAVVPMAFCISGVMELYKTNIAGKQLLPVKVTKVEPNSGVDMIDFGGNTPDASQTEGERELEEEAIKIIDLGNEKGQITAEKVDVVKGAQGTKEALPDLGIEKGMETAENIDVATRTQVFKDALPDLGNERGMEIADDVANGTQVSKEGLNENGEEPENVNEKDVDGFEKVDVKEVKDAVDSAEQRVGDGRDVEDDANDTPKDVAKDAGETHPPRLESGVEAHEPPSTPSSNASPEAWPSTPPSEQPSEPPPVLPASPPPEQPSETLVVLPSSPPPEQPSEPPPMLPSSPPPEQPSEPPPALPSSPLSEQSLESPPLPPSELPPEPLQTDDDNKPENALCRPPSEIPVPPPEPPSEKPPEPLMTQDVKVENGSSKESMETGEIVESNGEVKVTNSHPNADLSEIDEALDGCERTPDKPERSADVNEKTSEPRLSPTAAGSTLKGGGPDEGLIKITFQEDDEFAKLDADVKPPDIFHDVLVSPRTWNEKGYFNARQERLRIKGDPDHRVGPYDRRDPQATAILGASCHSAASEIIKATFLDGHVVVYKPHPYNAEVDRVWAEVLKPLVEIGAVSFCLADQGPELVKDPRVDQIYMTGSAETGQLIMGETGKPCVLETGGVNPVILVPGLDRPWKTRELRHHALQIASAGKFNGGHFCGRPQVIVTSKSWDQREVFLDELEKAISERTPPEGSYDPKYRKVFDRFVQEYPEGKIIEAEGLATDSARVLLVTGASEDSYGLKTEAFCQVFIEVALGFPDHPVAFLPEAVKFCNEKLYGSLCATIVIDDVNNKKYHGIVQQALSDLNYGTVSTNAMACFGWFNPSLYWGSYNVDDENSRAKGVGHYGNLMGYQSAVKSVITDTFCGSGHWIKTCRDAYAEKIAALSHYALEPSMKKVSAYKYKGVRAAAARKDW